LAPKELSNFQEIFVSLRQMMLSAASGEVIAKDLPGDLVIRTRRIDPRTEAPGWFGTVTIKKSYVACHLIGLYDHPELAAEISDGLRKRQQGKTCFNFRKLDPDLSSELSRLSEVMGKVEADRNPSE